MRTISKTAKKCSICGGQRRQFGWGKQHTQKKEKIIKREIYSQIV